jgi:hypothetical protein
MEMVSDARFSISMWENGRLPMMRSFEGIFLIFDEHSKLEPKFHGRFPNPKDPANRLCVP